MPQNLDQAVQNAYSDLYAAFAAKAAKYIDQARPGQAIIGRVIGYPARFGIGCRRSRQAGRRQIPSTV